MSVIDWITVGAALLSIPLFVLVIRSGHDERHEEDEARAFFDRHGRWPDEPDEAVDQPGRRLD